MGHEAAAATPLGVYKPRRPQASPLFRLTSDHMQRLETVYDERDLAVGIVACLQTHGSRTNWHPHLLVTDGGFRPDGTFVSWPAHDTAGTLTWPHSGFDVRTGTPTDPAECGAARRSPPPMLPY